MCVCVQYRDGLSKEAGPGLDECAASPRGLQFEQVRCRMSGALDGLLTNPISSVHCEVLQTLLCLPVYGGGVYSPGEVGRDHGAQECEILKSLHRVIIYVEVKVVCSVSGSSPVSLWCSLSTQHNADRFITSSLWQSHHHHLQTSLWSCWCKQVCRQRCRGCRAIGSTYTFVGSQCSAEERCGLSLEGC